MKYSIITPVYNREDCLLRCLESVERNLSNDYEIEHLIVDDGSADRSPGIARHYAESHPHARFFQFDKNRGTNAARNHAIANATGVFCIILDSDDYFKDDALSFINGVVSKTDYKAYMFAPDDMTAYYRKNRIIRGRESAELNFGNFLRGEIGGDFIHCIRTDILKRNPFDEYLRTYEGVFFLRFFKEAQKMLFTNHVVTIRERSRADSVTRMMIASNRKAIRKGYKANCLRYVWFENDYLSLKETGAITNLLNDLLFQSMLLSERGDSKKWFDKIEELNLEFIPKNRKLYKFHLGGLYFLMMKTYFILKYNILNKRLK